MIFFRVSYAEFAGTRYSKGSFVFCTIDDDVPVFGKILDIVVLGTDDCLFVVQPYAGVFCSHYNAYEVYTIPTSYLFYKQNDLIDHHILSFSKSFSPPLSHKLFVSLKYHVFV